MSLYMYSAQHYIQASKPNKLASPLAIPHVPIALVLRCEEKFVNKLAMIK